MKLIKKLGMKLNKNGNKRSWGEFLCPDCHEKVERTLSNGYKQNSCGCIKSKNNNYNLKHGETDTRLYKIWQGIKNRCLNINVTGYQNYGGRGITISPEWTNDYTVFRDWSLSNGYEDNLTIDRIENDGNYEPDNCQWITQKENSRKTRTTKLNLEKANKIRELNKTGNYTQQELAEKYKVKRQNISDIINNKIWKNV